MPKFSEKASDNLMFIAGWVLILGVGYGVTRCVSATKPADGQPIEQQIAQIDADIALRKLPECKARLEDLRANRSVRAARHAQQVSELGEQKLKDFGVFLPADEWLQEEEDVQASECEALERLQSDLDGGRPPVEALQGYRLTRSVADRPGSFGRRAIDQHTEGR